MMSKGMIMALGCAWLLASSPLWAEGEIYKVVDENGNVTYTDQRPSTGAEPMDLPGLSVIATDVAPPPAPAAAGEETERQPTARELKRQLRDFRITQPRQEETFWGTANTVVVAWGSSQPIPANLSARLYIDGEPREVPPSGSVSLTLDRGEHQVYVELLDERNRSIIATDTVTFFVKQASVGFNRVAPTPRNQGP